jgi:H+/Na+-translocating ferredoxin:NAD+ oxidoreductase subunit C
MKAVTFKGGIHPRYEKELTAGKTTVPLDAPAQIVIPLSQHIGAPARACVEKGDDVLRGQVVAEAGGFVSVCMHSSVSGKVTAIEPRPSVMGVDAQAIVIENDGEDRQVEFVGLGTNWSAESPEDIKNKISDAGIVGMGGAAFPTHVKLSPPKEKPIDTVILNGAECEPFLTADHRLMLERPSDVVTGLQIMLKVLGAKRGIIGIEKNKPDAIEAIRLAAKDTDAEVVSLEIKYPQGAEKQLIDACLDRQVPSAGLPMDVKVVVQNVGTAVAVRDAVIDGMPLMERIVTVTGPAIAEPANLKVRIGTPLQHAIEACKGIKGELGKLISGGPMMGIALTTDEVAVTKGTSGILALDVDSVYTKAPGPCIRCGRCVRVCPMCLVPTTIAIYSTKGQLDNAEAADVLDCIECGSCSFGCPSRIPLVQQIRLGKSAVLAMRKKA